MQPLCNSCPPPKFYMDFNRQLSTLNMTGHSRDMVSMVYSRLRSMGQGKKWQRS
jgi:hypothetical protein